MSLLSIEEVTHMYGDKLNFREISFRLLRGEHVGLVGGNGAGKSTLLRLLAGEILPDAGRIDWMPQVKVGYLQQHIHLQPGMTIAAYLQSAFAHLYAIERRMIELAESMAEAGDQLDALLRQYGEMQHQLESSDFYQLQGRVEEVAAGLGILDLGLERDVSKLSGGQRTKLLLGKLLLEEPDVLLLDEPTNYLDDAHIAWLTGYLKSYEHAFIVVSHDEHFLNEITTIIYHLEHQTLRRYPGNYNHFLKSHELSRLQLQQTYDRQQQEITRLEGFINKNRIRKAKQAKSREKALARIDRIDKPTNGPQPRFSFEVRQNPVTHVITAKGIQIGYSTPLIAPVNLEVKRGDKIAIIGHNGIGKSTMLRTLLGLMPLMNGTLQIGDNVKAAYFAQENIASDQTPLERLLAFRTDLTQQQIRKMLAMPGLTEKHIRQPLRHLSGGEQAKVRLCELMLTESNVLVLDEPTNHLDVRSKDAFREALKAYPGTILLVSHEPEFYKDWVTHVWRVEDWCRGAIKT
ncbi:ABC-F family ATP-binding cassette domain-containing protein [Paenibacillus guangzhouensis]|uniref:ABC-F family ATP-binding cassette domain-containing protein n=1 Tax=Paenibacillus guangzhouensis TaxID=1473112 RepID=UPI00126715FB|nr:ABC-F family ATP-binding cassette domain-containing protein [Paenibacillus guangzhouensis]